MVFLGTECECFALAGGAAEGEDRRGEADEACAKVEARGVGGSE